MFEYLPWSKKESELCLQNYTNKQLSILDLELGGECNFNCVYCDSPDRKKKCNISITDIDRLMSEGRFRWVYICGLGEPTYGENYIFLINILKLCEKYDIRCSIFSNLSNLSEELKAYIRKGILYILFKYDTKKVSRVRSLYGTRSKRESEVQLGAIEEIWSLVHLENGLTNIAASIVPTQLNYSELPDIIDECITHNVFPLIGELELSGKGQTNYYNLFLNQEELASIKNHVDEIWKEPYSIPACPAVVNGLHINNQNEITVDSFSGLSCHWFWLEEPRTETIAILNRETSLDSLTSAVFSYRQDHINDVIGFLKKYTHIGGAFGGCGGDVNHLFKIYLKSMGVEYDLS